MEISKKKNEEEVNEVKGLVKKNRCVNKKTDNSISSQQQT